MKVFTLNKGSWKDINKIQIENNKLILNFNDEKRFS